jgi:23S rRNA pseudouridine2605 synthase
MERLQRILSARGIASRRVAEEMILAGRVSVNGETVTELGTRANPDSDVIRVDGKVIRPQQRRYVMLNKPRGFITTTSDERNRSTVMDLIHTRERLYPIGRLDRETEGLLLLTNDGELANRVMHPRFGLEKEYHILTPERPDPRVIERVRRGIEIEGKQVVPNEFRLLRETRDGVMLTISLHEGMYHVVRRIMDYADIPVLKLTRVRVGPITMAGLPVGHWRDLRDGERSTLFEAVHMDLPEEDAATRRTVDIDQEQERHRERRPGFEHRSRPSGRTDGPRRPGGPRHVQPREGRPADDRPPFRPRRDNEQPEDRRDVQPRDRRPGNDQRGGPPRDPQRPGDRREFQPAGPQRPGDRRVFQQRDAQRPGDRREFQPRDGQRPGERREIQPGDGGQPAERRGPRRFNPQRDAWRSDQTKPEQSPREAWQKPQRRPERPNRDFNPRDRDDRTPVRTFDHTGRPIHHRDQTPDTPERSDQGKSGQQPPAERGNSRKERGTRKQEQRRDQKPANRRDESRGAAPRHDRSQPRPPQGDRNRRPSRRGQDHGGKKTGDQNRRDAV